MKKSHSFVRPRQPLLLLLLSTSSSLGSLLGLLLVLSDTRGKDGLELLVLDGMRGLDLVGSVPDGGRRDDEGTGGKKSDGEEELGDVRTLLGGTD